MTIEADNVAILKRAYEDWDRSKGAGTDYLMGIFHKDVQFTSLADGASEVASLRPARGRTTFSPISTASPRIGK